MNDVSTVAIGVAFLIAFATPVIVASAPGRGVLIFLSFLLTVTAAVVLTFSNGFGDTVLVGAVWIGAIICGLGAFIDRAMTRNARNSAFRLLQNDATGLSKPGERD